MIDDKLEKKIIDFFSNNTNNTYTLKELSNILKIGKHKYRNLKDTLVFLTNNWDLTHKKGKYALIPHRRNKKKQENKIITGIFDATPLAKGYSFSFVLNEKKDIYISSEDTLNAYHGDEVEVEVFYSKKDKSSGRITKVLKRKNDKFVGNIINYKLDSNRYKNLIFVPDFSKIHTLFNLTPDSEMAEGKKVVIEITYWGNRNAGKLPTGKVVEILGDSDNNEIQVLGIIKQFDLPLTFPDSVHKELESIYECITESQYKNRKDYRNILTFTIDPVSAKDYDDAVSYVEIDDKKILYVHIADVAEYISLESSIYKEAFSRGNSYYFPRLVIPMLPEKLSNKICSLRPDEDKLTITVVTHFDSDFKIIKQEVKESVTRSDARLTYEEVDLLFADKENNIPDEISDILKQMRLFSKEILRKRIDKGYLNFSLPDLNFLFNDSGEIEDIKRDEETESHKLIENCMLIANEFIAKTLAKKFKSCIYRVHGEPGSEKLHSLKETLEKYNMTLNLKKNVSKELQRVIKDMPNDDYHRVFDKVILQSLQKAKYHTQNVGHFGLSMPYYTHFTSPIRRLCDLLVHHQLKSLINNKQTQFFIEKRLAKAALQATEKENLADQSEREVAQLYKKMFMRTKIGEEFEGIIVSLNSHKIIVELDDYPVTGVVKIIDLSGDKYDFFMNRLEIRGKRTGKCFRLTQRLKIKVASVSDDIYFTVV